VEVFHLVVDTNVLLHQLDALQQFTVDIEHHLPFTLQIIIPGIVISELDRRVYSIFTYWLLINVINSA
jgi:predicted ribonuclease YlaK